MNYPNSLNRKTPCLSSWNARNSLCNYLRIKTTNWMKCSELTQENIFASIQLLISLYQLSTHRFSILSKTRTFFSSTLRSKNWFIWLILQNRTKGLHPKYVRLIRDKDPFLRKNLKTILIAGGITTFIGLLAWAHKSTFKSVLSSIKNALHIWFDFALIGIKYQLLYFDRILIMIFKQIPLCFCNQPFLLFKYY